MELTRIAGGPCVPGDDDDPPCGSGDCPTVFVTQTGSVVVQGYVFDHAVGDGEGTVEIPVEVLLEAARALRG